MAQRTGCLSLKNPCPNAIRAAGAALPTSGERGSAAATAENPAHRQDREGSPLPPPNGEHREDMPAHVSTISTHENCGSGHQQLEKQ
jgi:hypothetical protein